MAWRLSILHRTGFEYEGEVTASYNQARLTPCSSGGQLLLDHAVNVDPRSGVFSAIDYWGTRVHSFDVHVPHQRLEVTGRSLVETAEARTPPAPVDWETLADSKLVDEMCEYLAPSRMTQPDESITSLAASLGLGLSPAEMVDAAIGWVRANVGYERGVTSVETPATGVLAARRGVCQDFAHLVIGVLRSAGIPARYVSGYLYPDVDAAVGESVGGESHAWVEAWIGEWWAVDPTSGGPVGHRHARVAHGRDYRDVAPLRGIFHGSPSKALLVSVELTRTA
jgi:transglutaminase-like putative cysteine protease